jgi:glycosyltransferase involved in cell wall biosynthesis
MTADRILFIQFADPAAYPPIEHSSGILADLGCHVVLLGTDAFGDQMLRLPHHPRREVKNLPWVKAQSRVKLQYLIFCLWSLYWTATWRPKWIYGSDPLTLPVLWLLSKFTGARIIYHEHDSPNLDWIRSRFYRAVLFCRKALGAKAEVCVVPQQERLLDFLQATQRTQPTICVWNCPRQDEICEVKSDESHQLIVYYHGSINRSRLPAELIIAASRFKGAVLLQIAGYETSGSIGYIQELTRLAAENGASRMIQFLGTIPLRKDLLDSASKAHVGLSLMPKSSDDVNLRHMVGASNKPFDYMACGLPLLVTDSLDWTSTFVCSGFARACDPADADSIEAQLRWYIEHPDERREMGRRSREKIRKTWNYETMFAPVLSQMRIIATRLPEESATRETLENP